jgi:hypothetical protein
MMMLSMLLNHLSMLSFSKHYLTPSATLKDRVQQALNPCCAFS